MPGLVDREGKVMKIRPTQTAPAPPNKLTIFKNPGIIHCDQSGSIPLGFLPGAHLEVNGHLAGPWVFR